MFCKHVALLLLTLGTCLSTTVQLGADDTPVAADSAGQASHVSTQIKLAIESWQSLELTVQMTLLAAQDVTKSTTAQKTALQSAVDAADNVNEVRAKLQANPGDAELKADLTTKQTTLDTKRKAYLESNSRLEIAKEVYRKGQEKLNAAFKSTSAVQEGAIKSVRAVVDKAAGKVVDGTADGASEGTKSDKAAAAAATQKPKPATSTPPATKPAAGSDDGGTQDAPAAEPKRDEADQELPEPPAKPAAEGGVAKVINPHVREMNSASTPTRLTDAFLRLPLLQEVKSAVEPGDFHENSATSAAPASTDSAPEFLYDFRFDRPAHFPLGEFGLGGEFVGNDGLIIYEGMRLAIRPDGRYQVRFVVGTPAVPVEMKIQFVLEDQAGRRYSLTLPRVAIPQKNKPAFATQRREIDPVYQSVQTVHHEGFLPFLAQQPQSLQMVRRTGTARFGFGVDVP